MAATEPIRNKKNIGQMADYFLKKGQFRNYVMVVMGVHTALRISDLLRLAWDDVYDFDAKRFRTHLRVTEKKTGKSKTVALNKQIIRALRLYTDSADKRKKGRFIFESNRRNRAPISRIQAYRLIREAAAAIGARGNIACHSLRKSFGYHAWKKGVPVAVIMDIYNHTSFDITRRYLGVCQDDRDQVYMSMSFA